MWQFAEGEMKVSNSVLQSIILFYVAPTANFKSRSLSGCKALTISAMCVARICRRRKHSDILKCICCHSGLGANYDFCPQNVFRPGLVKVFFIQNGENRKTDVILVFPFFSSKRFHASKTSIFCCLHISFAPCSCTRKGG